MTYNDFALVVYRAGLEPRLCAAFHWQIIGGERLVNVWPQTKRGFRFQRYGEKVRDGSLAEAIESAGPVVAKPAHHPEVEAPWEGEAQQRSASPHVGLIRRFWRIIW